MTPEQPKPTIEELKADYAKFRLYLVGLHSEVVSSFMHDYLNKFLAFVDGQLKEEEKK